MNKKYVFLPKVSFFKVIMLGPLISLAQQKLTLGGSQYLLMSFGKPNSARHSLKSYRGVSAKNNIYLDFKLNFLL